MLGAMTEQRLMSKHVIIHWTRTYNNWVLSAHHDVEITISCYRTNGLLKPSIGKVVPDHLELIVLMFTIFTGLSSDPYVLTAQLTGYSDAIFAMAVSLGSEFLATGGRRCVWTSLC
jgi:hypothetical protein